MSWIFGLIKNAKFLNNRSALCETCVSYLNPVSIVRNPNHIYTLGTMFVCNCGKSKIWTNSVRDEEYLLKYFRGKIDRYIAGFCNDKFEGNTLKHLYPIRNGIKVPGIPQSLDRYGLKTDNPNEPRIALDLRAEGKENDTGPILEWYRERLK